MTIPNFPCFDAIDNNNNNNNFTLKRIKHPWIINNNVKNDNPPQELPQFTRAIMCPSPMPTNGLLMPKALKRYSDSPIDAQFFWRNHDHIVKEINKP